MKKRGNKKGRAARASDLENLQKAQGKQTGPITDEGKEIVSMNALTSGEFLKKFHRIYNRAGELAICGRCGEEQKTACKNVKSCALQDYFIAMNVKSRDERNPEFIENVNIVSLSTMRIIFESRLKYGIEHIDDLVTDAETGATYHRIGWKYIEGLLRLGAVLGIDPDQMMLNRKTMDSSDNAWAVAVNEEIERSEAREYMKKLDRGFEKLSTLNERTAQARAEDKDIQEYQNSISNDGDTDDAPDINAVKDAPFGEQKN